MAKMSVLFLIILENWRRNKYRAKKISKGINLTFFRTRLRHLFCISKNMLSFFFFSWTGRCATLLYNQKYLDIQIQLIYM
jgi:hypothetical protein